MAVKFKTDFIQDEAQAPRLSFQYNTPSEGLEEQVFKKFVALAQQTETITDPDTLEESEVFVYRVIATTTINENGTTTVVLSLEGGV